MGCCGTERNNPDRTTPCACSDCREADDMIGAGFFEPASFVDSTPSVEVLPGHHRTVGAPRPRTVNAPPLPPLGNALVFDKVAALEAQLATFGATPPAALSNVSTADTTTATPSSGWTLRDTLEVAAGGVLGLVVLAIVAAHV